MHDSIRGFGAAILLVAGSTVFSLSAAQQVPPQLVPAANDELVLQVHATGDLIYTCKMDGTQFSWTLKEQREGPESPSFRLRRLAQGSGSPHIVFRRLSFLRSEITHFPGDGFALAPGRNC